LTSFPVATQAPAAVFDKFPKRGPQFSVVLSVLLIACGFLAILLPVEMSFGVVVVVAWLLMVSGIMQFVHVFGCRGIGHATWKALVAVIYFGTGLYLRLNLRLGITALTLVLIAFFVTQGLIDVFMYFATRKKGTSGWLLVDGVLTLILGLMIRQHWPSGSLSVVGLLVGINMIVTGTTRLMLTFAARRAVRLLLMILIFLCAAGLAKGMRLRAAVRDAQSSAGKSFNIREGFVAHTTPGAGVPMPTKLCSAVYPFNWRDTVAVPDTWKASSCQNFAHSLGKAQYQLGCANPSSFSWGDANGSIPEDNRCGW